MTAAGSARPGKACRGVAGVVCPGRARRVSAGMAWPDLLRFGWVGRGRLGSASSVQARRGSAWQSGYGSAGLGPAWFRWVRHGVAGSASHGVALLVGAGHGLAGAA